MAKKKRKLKHLGTSTESPSPKVLKQTELQNAVLPRLTGLRNMDSTCYMNAILQSLCSVQPLVEYFLSGQDMEEKTSKVATAFSHLVQDIYLKKYKCMTPKKIRQVIGQVNSIYMKPLQQDAEEFLVLILEELHKDLKADNNKKQQPIACGDESIISKIFEGNVVNSKVCLTCQKISKQTEVFNVLSLAIPSPDNCTLQACLDKHFSEEMMTGDNQYRCSFCDTSRDARTSVRIESAPRVMILQLKRITSAIFMEDTTLLTASSQATKTGIHLMTQK